jgi:hypothetical protein
MKTAIEIINKIGKPRVKAGLGVTDRTIDHHTYLGVLPASWFDFCEKATRRRLDRRLFSFKGAVE